MLVPKIPRMYAGRFNVGIVVRKRRELVAKAQIVLIKEILSSDNRVKSRLVLFLGASVRKNDVSPAAI